MARHLVADAVAWAGVMDADLFGDSAQVAVVVGVHEAILQGVVVDIGDGKLRLDARDADGLKLQIGHRAGGVLRECLVDAQPDFAAGPHLPLNKVGGDDFLSKCLSHR